MKKLLWMGLLLILSVSCCGFSSCHGPQYEEAERDAMEEAGRKQMQAWLDEPICPAKAVRYVGQRKQRDGLSRKKDDNTHI